MSLSAAIASLANRMARLEQTVERLDAEVERLRNTRAPRPKAKAPARKPTRRP